MSKYLFTIIIPTYKRNDILPRAIDSVLSNKGSFEIIVVDDNNETSMYRKKNIQLMNGYKSVGNIKYYTHKSNMNGAAARNTGIKYAEGEYITFLDDDDEFSKDRVSVISEVIKEHQYDFIFTGYEVKRANKIIEQKRFDDSEISVSDLMLFALKAKSFYGTGSNIVCRKEIIHNIDGFDIAFSRGQDFEFLVRYLKHCKDYKYIDQILVTKNVDDKSNIPSSHLFISIKKQFLEKYSDYLEELDEDDKRDVIFQNYREALYWAHAAGDKAGVKEIQGIMREYGIYSFFDDKAIPLKISIKRMLGKF